LPGGIFEAGSNVNVEIHSNTLSLGAVSADQKGGISETVPLPEDILSGFHTLHLLGTSRDGRQIDVYQVIAIEGNNSDVALTESQPTSSTMPVVLINTASMPVSKSTINEVSTPEVLGAHESKDIHSIIPKTISKFVKTVAQATTNNWIIVGAILSGVIVVLLMTIAILLRIRWAKSST